MGGSRLVVVGGGVIGTLHALAGLDRGYEVVHIEREPEPRGASVRNFGLIWVSGRGAGSELELALRARTLWEDVGRRCPDARFRACGSLTLATTEGEWAVLTAAGSAPDAGVRGFELLEPSAVRRLHPAVDGPLVGALRCTLDAAVEPRLAVGALRRLCHSSGQYRFVAPREIVKVGDRHVIDDRGVTYGGDRVILCTGAAHRGVAAEILEGAPVRRVRLQMLETEPHHTPVTTAIADADTMRYYPAFAQWRHQLAPPDPVVREWEAQLLLVQRIDGSLTIGDTHASAEPFPFDVDEMPYRHLVATASRLLGTAVPPVARRWAGVYSQVTSEDAVYLRAPVADAVEIVTGPGGRGMTMAPAIAEETFT